MMFVMWAGEAEANMLVLDLFGVKEQRTKLIKNIFLGLWATKCSQLTPRTSWEGFQRGLRKRGQVKVYDFPFNTNMA